MRPLVLRIWIPLPCGLDEAFRVVGFSPYRLHDYELFVRNPGEARLIEAEVLPHRISSGCVPGPTVARLGEHPLSLAPRRPAK
jgi:hypothetical protein